MYFYKIWTLSKYSINSIKVHRYFRNRCHMPINQIMSTNAGDFHLTIHRNFMTVNTFRMIVSWKLANRLTSSISNTWLMGMLSEILFEVSRSTFFVLRPNPSQAFVRETIGKGLPLKPFLNSVARKVFSWVHLF